MPPSAPGVEEEGRQNVCQGTTRRPDRQGPLEPRAADIDGQVPKELLNSAPGSSLLCSVTAANLLTPSIVGREVVWRDPILAPSPVRFY